MSTFTSSLPDDLNEMLSDQAKNSPCPKTS